MNTPVQPIAVGRRFLSLLAAATTSISLIPYLFLQQFFPAIVESLQIKSRTADLPAPSMVLLEYFEYHKALYSLPIFATISLVILFYTKNKHVFKLMFALTITHTLAILVLVLMIFLASVTPFISMCQKI